MTVDEFDIEGFVALMVRVGYAEDIRWAEQLGPPASAEDFAREVIFVICNSGMKNTIAAVIFKRVMKALESGERARSAFGHPGKAHAIDHIWRFRGRLWLAYMDAPDKLAWLEGLPWIGGITKFHLAKNFGMEVAKPDVHLQRLAATFATTPQALCEGLAKRSGYRVATIRHPSVARGRHRCPRHAHGRVPRDPSGRRGLGRPARAPEAARAFRPVLWLTASSVPCWVASAAASGSASAFRVGAKATGWWAA